MELARQFRFAQERMDLSVTQTVKEDGLTPALRAWNQMMGICLRCWQGAIAQRTH